MIIKKLFKKTKLLFLNSRFANKVFYNSSWMIGEKIVTMVVGVFVTAVVARYFGPTGYGQFNYALSFIALFTVISTLGLENLTVKSIIDKDYDEGTIIFTSFSLRLIGGIILTIFAGIIIRIVDPGDQNIHTLVLILSFNMILRSFEVIEYWIQAHQKAKISSSIRMIVYIIVSVFKLSLIFLKGSLIQYAMIYIFDGFIISLALVMAYYYNKDKKVKFNINFQYMRYILSKSWYFILSGLMISINSNMDKIMLGSMFSTKFEVGLYSAASQIAHMWFFIPIAVIVSFQPVILNEKKKNEKRYIESIQLLYTIITWLGIFFAIFIILFSKPIVLILYGKSYIKSASILMISVWAGTFSILGSARSIWLISEGLHKYTIWYTAVGVTVNIALNFFLIPNYGAYGAAVATLVSSFSANVLALAIFKETRLSSIMIIKSFSIRKLIKLFTRY